MRKTKLTAQGAAVELLSRQGYSRIRLARKLREKEYADSEIEAALHYVEEYGWLNDYEYAFNLTQSRVNRGYGAAYIRQYLRSKEISRDVIEAVFVENEWDWFVAIHKAFCKKFQCETYEDRLRQKYSAYLYRRGFDSELIRTFLAQTKENYT